MSNKKLVKEYYQKVVNTGNVDIIANYISPDYFEVHDNKIYKMGIEGAIGHIKGVRKTYAGLTLDIHYQIAEGDRVATCYTMTGIHVGEWMGIKPTGKKIKVTGVNIDRVAEGKIVEHGGAANLLSGLLEIGAIKLVKQT